MPLFSSAPSPAAEGRFDSSLRPVLTGLPQMKVKSMALSKDSRAALSGEQLLDLENRFKRYTYMLFIGAQLWYAK